MRDISESPTTAKKKIDAILVLLDVVEYTPQARRLGATSTFEFDQYLKDQLTKRAEKCGFHFIKSIGDAALLWGRETDGLVSLIRDLFIDDPIREHKGFQVRLRMLAHEDVFVFQMDGDRVVAARAWSCVASRGTRILLGPARSARTAGNW